MDDEVATALLIGARMAAASGDREASVALSREAVGIREARFAPTSPKLAEARAELGRALVLADDPGTGRALLGEALPALESWGLLHPDDRAELRAAFEG